MSITRVSETEALTMARVVLERVADDPAILEIARKAIEDELIGWRDSRLSEPMRGNGLVIREKTGEESSIIRFGPETAMRIGLKAIAKALSVGRSDA